MKQIKKVYITVYMIIINLIMAYMLFNYNIDLIKYIYATLLLVYTLESLELIDFENLTIENVYNRLFKKRKRQLMPISLR